MRYISPLISDARNKIGGLVFAANPYGPYARRRVAPAQPRTPPTQANRARFATFAQQWRTLDQSARTAWNAWAGTVEQRDSLGQLHRLSGFQQFIRAALNNAQYGHTPPAGPPRQSYKIATCSFVVEFAGYIGGIFALRVIPVWPGGSIIGQVGTFSATPGLSPSVGFVPRQTYRFLTPPYVTGSSNVSLEDAYLAVFPPPPGGTVIHLKFRPLDTSTGQVGNPTYAYGTVL